MAEKTTPRTVQLPPEYYEAARICGEMEDRKIQAYVRQLIAADAKKKGVAIAASSR